MGMLLLHSFSDYRDEGIVLLGLLPYALHETISCAL